jgi:hypothetical protein
MDPRLFYFSFLNLSIRDNHKAVTSPLYRATIVRIDRKALHLRVVQAPCFHYLDNDRISGIRGIKLAMGAVLKPKI